MKDRNSESSAERKNGNMKLVTFNLRYDNPADGENRFTNRRPLILRIIREKKPDVICFQEVLPHMAAWLRAELTDYWAVGCPRGEHMDGEQGTIAFRKDGYQLLEMHNFWLSDTPAVPGSRYPGQSDCPRICTALVLWENESGTLFRVLNTHLDHVGIEARERGLKQILAWADTAEPFSGVPMILAGDFNAEPDSPELAVLRERPDLINATAGTGVTYHGFGRADHPSAIDYIVLRGAGCAGVQRWTEKENSLFLSDHYPVCADIVWRTA